MNRLERLGAWYSDITLEGDYASLFNNSYIEVYDSIAGVNHRIELPSLGENVLFLKLYRSDNRLFICGQGQSGKAWFLELGKKWINVALCFGTWGPCLFANNLFYVVTSGNTYSIYSLDNLTTPISTHLLQIGVNGIRQVLSDGTVITGDMTYDGSQLSVNLAEYTIWNDRAAGQSYVNGCIVVTDPTLPTELQSRVMVEPGDCRFIQFHKDGDNLGIAIVKQSENRAVFYWLTVFELSSFPPEGIIPPDPIPPIDPEEPPIMPQPPNYQSYLQNVKDRLVANGENLSGTAGGKIVEQFAWEKRAEAFALLRKDGGNNWKGNSVDYLCYGFQDNFSASDVVGDCGGQNNIQWPGTFEQGSGIIIRVTSDPGYLSGTIPIPPIDPPIDPPNPPNTELEERVAVLEQQVKDLQTNSLQSGSKIALKTNDDVHYLRAHDQGGLTREQKPLATDSMGVGPDELFKIEKQ